MKPRLKSAPLTEEDELIWSFVDGNEGAFRWLPLEDFSTLADRRDADLMFALERLRNHWWVKYNMPPDYPRWPAVMTLMRAEYATTGQYDITDCA